jgi:hypothetical protein
MNLRPIKACHACGASYTLHTWPGLTLAEITATPTGATIEHRSCICGERLSLDVEQARLVADALPPKGKR